MEGPLTRQTPPQVDRLDVGTLTPYELRCRLRAACDLLRGAGGVLEREDLPEDLPLASPARRVGDTAELLAAQEGEQLVLLAPLFLVLAVLVKLDSRGPIFFCQQRLGRDFRPFRIFKFRTMIRDQAADASLLTHGNIDPRITRLGSWLRKTKLDELPQLVNVLRGEMSLVGPRPEVSKYVEMFHSDYEEILRVRPGLTDIASLKYQNEEQLLAAAEDPEAFYVGEILPDKIALSKRYVANSSLTSDLVIIFKTLGRVRG